MWWARLLNQIAAIHGTGAAPAAATSYESIATFNGTGSSAIIEFTSIPSTFKHLQLRAVVNTTGGGCTITFNNDTGNNYARHYLFGNGSTVTAGGQATQSNADIVAQSATTNIAAANIIDILDYANTNKYKTNRTLAGVDQNGSGYVVFQSGSWRNTAAITSITILTNAVNYTQYSHFALYGIKGA
jgi:hypothetical protein